MSKEKEIWREIEGYEGNYEVSSFGRVKKLAYSYVRNNRFRDYLMNADEHFVTHTIVKKGKHNVSLFKWVNGERKKLTTFVHIVVAKAFLEKPEGVRHQVRHKDKNTDNNRASNLEWLLLDNANHFVSSSQDIKNYDVKKAKISRPVAMYNILNNETIDIFPSVSEASRRSGVGRCNIHRLLKKQLDEKNGCSFRYVEIVS
tara:strand:- start:273 stop:875 length:603 start_codon:yes stop_codon:yes gene_type:complete